MQGFLVHAKQWDDEAETLEEAGGKAAKARADTLRSCAAQVRDVVDGERGDAPGVVIVDGVSYPFDLTTVDGRQIVWMRTIQVSFQELLLRVAVSMAEIPEIVALMALSIEQRGEEADLLGLLSQVTLSSVVDFAMDDALFSPA